MNSITNLKLNILVFFSIYFFVCGADGYIILPTAWYYIHSLGLSKSFYGAVLATQSLGFLIFCPVVGKLADKTRRGKLILLVCILVKITANLVYAIPVSGYCPLVGCFFSGAASAAYGVMYGDIVRNTITENRSKLFILVDSMYTLGASCGPVFGSLVTFKANILGWNINNGNSPGIVLAVIWSVLLCVLIFLPSKFEAEDICITDIDEVDLLEDSKPYTVIRSSRVWCLFYLNFLNAVVATTSIGIVPLLAMELFHLDLLHVKLLFAAGVMFMFVLDLVLYIATSCYSERGILAFTIILQIPSLLLLSSYSILWTNAPFWMSFSLVLFTCFGIPQGSFAFAGSLLSKITPPQHASTIQSLLVADSVVAALVGRGLSGLLFVQMRLVGYSIVLVLLWLVGMVWLGFTFHRLAPAEVH